MNFCEFIQAASVLEAAETSIRPIFQANEALSIEQIQELMRIDAAVETVNPQIIFDCLAAGLTDLYFDCGDCDDETLASLYGKCRFIAHSKADIKQLDRICAPFLQPGYLESIGIQLKNSTDELAFTPNNVPEFARWIRFSQNLAVRGIFVGIEDHFAENTRQNYSLLKKIRCDMPCLFTYFCFSGLLKPLADGDEELLQSLKIVNSLNDTSLYAGFYIK